MRDFLLTVTAYSESATGPIRYESLRERLGELGLKDYLINDAGEWVALPDGTYAAWVEGDDSDALLHQWRERLAAISPRVGGRAAFLLTVGTDAAWQAQVFE